MKKPKLPPSAVQVTVPARVLVAKLKKALPICKAAPSYLPVCAENVLIGIRQDKTVMLTASNIQNVVCCNLPLATVHLPVVEMPLLETAKVDVVEDGKKGYKAKVAQSDDTAPAPVPEEAPAEMEVQVIDEDDEAPFLDDDLSAFAPEAASSKVEFIKPDYAFCFLLPIAAIGVLESLDGLLTLGLHTVLQSGFEYSAVSIASESGNFYCYYPPSTNDYPAALPIVDADVEITFDASEMKAIKTVAAAACTDPLRPAMQGIYFDLAKTGILPNIAKQILPVVATDAHLLYLKHISARVVNEKNLPSIYPISADAFRLFEGIESGVIRVQIAQDQSRFCISHVQADGWQYHGALIDSRYPEYQFVLPTKDETTVEVTVQRKDFIAVVKRCIAASTMPDVDVSADFKLDDNGMTVALRMQDGESFNSLSPVLMELLPAKVVCDEAVLPKYLSINPKLLLNVLTSYALGDTVTMQVWGGNKPVLFTLSNGDLALLMPVSKNTEYNF